MKRILALMLGTLLSLSASAKADLDPYYIYDFPDPDRAEVIAYVNQNAANQVKVEIDAAKARKLAKLVRAQTWYGSAPNCHKPQYVFRFYAHGKLIAADAICFYCGCFAPLSSDVHAGGVPQDFDTDSAASKRLQALLKQLSLGSHEEDLK